MEGYASSIYRNGLRCNLANGSTGRGGVRLGANCFYGRTMVGIRVFGSIGSIPVTPSIQFYKL